MWLTEVFSGGQINNAGKQVSGTSSAAGHSGAASVSRQIQALAPGQTLQGEVISRNGSQVQIQVADDLVLEAKIDQDINLEVGKTMTFEVRNNGQTLTLSPLFANTASQANALKALEMASLPVNQTTVSMTGLMMEGGLSIDRVSLQQMFREVNAFPEANVSDVVDLHRLGLAVNEENLAQIGSYKNLTHQLVEGMHTVLGALPDSMQAMAAEGNVEGAARMFQDLLEMIQGLPDADEAGNAVPGDAMPNVSAQAETVGGSTGEPNGGPFAGVGGTAGQTAVDLLLEMLTDMVNQTGGEAGGDAGTAIKADMTERVLQLAGNGADGEQLLAALQKAGDGILQLALQAAQNGDEALVGELARFSQIMQNGSLAEQAGALQQLLEHGLQGGNQQLLEELISGGEPGRLLTEGLSRLWTIEPKDVADAGRVEELYSRLDRQLKTLAQTLEQNGQGQSAAFKAVSNLNQNLDFMQQLNHAYTYVQLPLRLQQGDAHGDLYVYTNKRNLAAGDGQISALLHLDMEHLGPVDVYVTLQAEHVNTRFYVQDEAMLDFLEAHMGLLTERLQKRGYNCEFAMQVRDGGAEPESGVKGLLASEHAQPIARYAFDVRA